MKELLLKSYCEENGINKFKLIDGVYRLDNMAQPLILAQAHIMVYELFLFGTLENESGKLPIIRSEQDWHDYTDSVELINYNFEYAIGAKSNHISFHRLRLYMDFPASNQALFSTIKTGYIKYLSIIPKL